MKKIYLDNNIISAMGKDDMPSEQARAIAIISTMFDVGYVTLYTSHVTKEELDKQWREDAKKPEVLQRYNRIPQVPWVERQELRGFHTYADRGGTFLAWPMIEDHPLWSKLLAVGLKPLDAHHLMVAILAECDVFLTYDKKSFTKSRRNRIARAYPQIQIMWPSEVLYHL
jgi:predicted nucleic acid-binding protein